MTDRRVGRAQLSYLQDNDTTDLVYSQTACFNKKPILASQPDTAYLPVHDKVLPIRKEYNSSLSPLSRRVFFFQRV